MIVKPNTSVVDVALNLTGSIAGLPRLLAQLPAGARVGFDDLPELHQDVSDVGQTWTPDLVGMDLNINLPMFNPRAADKQPYSTHLPSVQAAIDLGNDYLYDPPPPLTLAEVPAGFNMRGKLITFSDEEYNTNPINIPATWKFLYMQRYVNGVADGLYNIRSHAVTPVGQTNPSAFIICSIPSNPEIHFMVASTRFWMYQRFRWPDDADYIVTSNQLDFDVPDGTWSFRDVIVTD